MDTLEKNTQVKFKTNAELLAKAKAIISEQDLDMTATFNLFLENIVENEVLPFETDKDKERKDLLNNLRKEIARSFDDLENGKVYSADEVRSNLGIR